ncbi:MAG: hypothetical protein MUP48_06495 [Wolbachia endosymbiont of Homalodisca vitripennis]|nr:hypothetical protein [Wolbachia endosymbiont of Homalodisca vitripennis]MCJ7455056.1 hypothetical protein [Wolbachia endosymbiont of Homalodisca vitripennis]MCJ7476443.1 hypothetical protein [Wolbachia endosymbiont of Homalodisca vitripennis]
MSFCYDYVKALKACINAGRTDCVKVNKHHDCHRWCEKNSDSPAWKSLCKRDCNSEYASFSDTGDTPEDISYYSADSFSVL